MKRLDRAAGWLGSPPGASFDPAAGDEAPANPFLRYRSLLWAHHGFVAAGRSDTESDSESDTAYVATVEALDARVAELDGRGFRVTPTVHAARLGEHLGVELWVKDETGNVTGTHKARHLMGLALHLDAERVPPEQRLAIASCGNAALAAATVARAARRPLDVFIPPWADPGIVAALAALEADTHVCPRRPGELGDPCFLRFREAVAAGALPFCAVGAENVLTIDGARTLAFEMIESLGDVADGDLDALFVQVGGGALASSVLQGFTEAADLGIIGRVPAIYPVQTETCAPLHLAWEQLQSAATAALADGEGAAGADAAGGEGARGDAARAGAAGGDGAEGGVARTAAVGADGDGEAWEAALARAVAEPDAFMQPWEPPEGDAPQSIATGILDDVTYDWLPILWGVAATGGDVIVVGEDLVVDAHDLARRHTAIPVDPTGTAGLAGLLAAQRDGRLPPGARVGLLFTGADRSAGPTPPQHAD